MPQCAEVTAPLVNLTQKRRRSLFEWYKAWVAVQLVAVPRITGFCPGRLLREFSKEFDIHIVYHTKYFSEAGVGASLTQLTSKARINGISTSLPTILNVSREAKAITR